MSSCLSSRACGFDLDHMIKWPCTTTSTRTTSNPSSPSSTLSESSNSSITISARKPRTPRKRPSQTYKEAAVLLSMACPSIFSIKHLTKRAGNLPKFTKRHEYLFTEPSELIENSGFLLRHGITERPCLLNELKVAKPCHNVAEMTSNCVSKELNDGCCDDFDTESILDDEIEQGIDILMGNSLSSTVKNDESSDVIASDFISCYGYPMVLGHGTRHGVRALRNSDERNSESFPMVKLVDISPVAPVICEEFPVRKKTKKKKKVDELMKLGHENHNCRDEHRRFVLKLNYDAVLTAWSNKESPVPGEMNRRRLRDAISM